MRNPHFSLLLTLIAVAVSALAAAPARANTYDVHLCDQFARGNGVSLITSPVPGFAPSVACGLFDFPQSLKLTAQSVGSGVVTRNARIGWDFSVPVNSFQYSFNSFSFDAANLGGRWQGTLAVGALGDGAQVLDLRPSDIGLPRTGHFDVSTPNARSVGGVMRCDFQSGCFAEDDSVGFQNVVVHANDNEAPAFTQSGSLLAIGQPVAGVASVRVDASDGVSGLAEVFMTIDNQLYRDVVLCVPPYFAVNPCPANASQTFSVDTSTLSDGPHQFSLHVDDGANNGIGFQGSFLAQNGVANNVAPTLSPTPTVGVPLTVTQGTWTSLNQPLTFTQTWLRCPPGEAGTAGLDCDAILGASGATYTPTQNDLNHRLLARVTANNGVRSATAGVLSAAVIEGAPVNLVKPVVTGGPIVGTALTADNGTWTGTSQTFAQRWLRCDIDGLNCADIPGAVGSLYTATSADIGHRLAVRVIATSAAGSASAVSDATAVVVSPDPNAAPVNLVRPTIVGAATVGSSLAVDTGVWSGGGTLTFMEQWLRCDEDNACEAIPGAVGPRYTLTGADLHHAVAVRVTATSAAGSSSVRSGPSEFVLDPSIANVTAPVSRSAPTLSGVAQVGSSLAADAGSWTGGGDLSFAHQWLRCDAGGANCVEIAGATTPQYTATGDDVGHRLAVRVTATNEAGSAMVVSDPSEVVTDPSSGGAGPRTPANDVKPTVVGVAQVGSSLGVDQGAWSGGGSLSFTDRWLRCDADGGNCDVISGATGPLYTVTGADIGHRLAVRVTASNEGGSTSVESDPTDVASDPTAGGGGGPSVPANDVSPTIVGDALVGSALAADAGRWSGGGTLAFARQWLRCDENGGACDSIPGETGAVYTVTGDDVGHRLVLRVTASNEAGSASVQSDPTAVVSDPNPGGGGGDPTVPANLVKPTVLGETSVGSSLGVDEGTWAGGGSLAFEERWLRCDADGNGCNAIGGAVGPLYTVTGADVGHRLAVEVTATNEAGSASVVSERSAVVSDPNPDGGGDAPTVPVNLVKPLVLGDAAVGSSLSADGGSWSGGGNLAFAHQWLRCDQNGANCEEISGAVAVLYTVTGDDVGHRLVLRVTASNEAGSASVQSDPTAVAVDPTAGNGGPTAPANVERPIVIGNATIGSLLGVDQGQWTGGGRLSFDDQWLRCNADGIDCAPISGAVGPVYTPTAVDLGHRIAVRVTAMNEVDSSSAASDPTAVVADPNAGGPPASPVNVVKPLVLGDAKVGSSLLVGAGGWTGGGSLAFSYQWLRCDVDGANCAVIDNAVGPLYTVTGPDNGHRLVARVTAANGAGSASAESDPTDAATDPTTGAGGPQRPGAHVPPTVIGELRVGALLTVDHGVWTGGGNLGFADQWLRCDAGGQCTPIDSATGASYTLTATDVGHRFAVRVTAANQAGSNSVVSAPSGLVLGQPSNDVKPVISGVASVGSSLSVNVGRWSGGDLAFRQRWLRCDAGDCAAIPGGVGPSYTVTGADLGHRLAARVTASNELGSASAVSDPSEVVVDPNAGRAPATPVSLDKPTIVGDVKVGSRLVLSHGGWSGGGHLAFADQWYTCDAEGNNCNQLPGITGTSYTVTGSDVGHRLLVQVTATNEAGSTTAASDPSNVALDGTPAGGPAVPVNLLAPAVEGEARVDAFMHVDRGAWSGGGNLTFFPDRWLRCDADGGNCQPAPGGIGTLYTPSRADIGHRIVVRVQAVNEAGVTFATSDPSDVVIGIPANDVKPVVTGTASVGSALSVDIGRWSGGGTIAFARQWLRCDAGGANCTMIAGATAATYTANAADAGQRLAVRVTAGNAAGTASVTSEPTAVVGGDRRAEAPLPFRILKVTFNRRTKALAFSVQVTGAGRLSASAIRRLKQKKTLVYGRKSVSTSAAGLITVVVKPGRKALAALRKAKKLKLTTTLSFTAAGAGALTLTRSVTVKQPRRQKKRRAKRKPAQR